MRVPSLAKALLTEMALDLGGASGFDPEKQRKIERGEHPYANNPAFPKQPGPGSYPPAPEHPQPGGRVQNYAELVASDQYKRIVAKMAQALNVPVQRISRQNAMPLMMQMQQALQQAMQWEAEHTEELTHMAVDLVLDFPEFAGMREAYENDTLRITATLGQPVETGDMNVEPPEPEEAEQAELQVAQIAQELDLEKEKRRFINMMTQGAAINKNHAYLLIRDRLNQINPQLVSAYAIAMSVGDWMYWVMPDEQLKAAMGAGEGAGGKARFEVDDDGVPHIYAEAIVFPVLIQELVKGLMDALAYFARQQEGTDPETQQHVLNQTDTMGNEVWDIMMGPAIWRQILRMIGPENQDLLRYIYVEIAKQPAQEFSRIKKGILQGDPEIRTWLQNLAQEIRAEHSPAEEPYADSGGDSGEEPSGGGGSPNEPDDDWWKKESLDRSLNSLIRRIIG